jgi:cysteine synthase A
VAAVDRYSARTRAWVHEAIRRAFLTGWATGASGHTTGVSSRIEGIGRPRVEPSFVPGVVDLMMPVPDAASIAAARFLRAHRHLSRRIDRHQPVGRVPAGRRMLAEGRRGSIVSLICDGGERYRHSYDDDAWLAAQGLELAPYTEILHRFAATGARPAAQT